MGVSNIWLGVVVYRLFVVSSLSRRVILCMVVFNLFENINDNDLY